MASDAYLDLRELILRTEPHRHGWAPSERLPRVWGALVEVGLPEGPVTLVSLVDGTTSLYLGNGGGTIGAGEAAPIAEASLDLLAALEAALEHLGPVWDFSLPETGRVRFVVLTYAGAFGADAAEAELVTGRHPLSAAFAASSDVLAGIQRLDAAVTDSSRRSSRPDVDERQPG
jgi:hypothetical protein